MEDREKYPGSDHWVGEKPPAPALADWGKPVTYNVGGVPTEFYTIGQVARALNRSPVTIRKWERLGWIPVAAFRSPARQKVKTNRLYSRAQLEAMVQIAWEEGLMRFTRGADGMDYPVAHVTETKFAERVRVAFARG